MYMYKSLCVSLYRVALRASSSSICSMVWLFQDMSERFVAPGVHSSHECGRMHIQGQLAFNCEASSSTAYHLLHEAAGGLQSDRQ